MEEVQKILSDLLLAFQLCLVLLQFVKLTPVGGLIQGTFRWLLSLPPFRLSRTYKLLQNFSGRVFKQVTCAVLTKAPALHDELTPFPSLPGEISDIIEFSYLDNDFLLERKDGNKLFINDKMCYYITDAMWLNLLTMKEFMADVDFVFVKGYKEFWKLVVAGGVMELEEALDCIILENHTVMYSDNSWLLPVNLSVSEEKALKLLNLVGLFLLTQKVFLLIPALLTLVSAILEFNTELRAWVYSNINRVFCRLMYLICDRLSYSMRRQVYSLGMWVENFQPCNDIQLRVVRGDICALIAGGAKADREDATVVSWLDIAEGETEKAFDCDPVIISYHIPEEDLKRFCLHVRYGDEDPRVEVDCNNRDEFVKMCTFVECLARDRSGSLKSYDGKNKVEVRGWKESVKHYSKSGYPPIYELRLQNVIVTSI